MDIQDAKFELDIKDLGYEVLLTNTIMDDPKSKALLAKNICQFIGISI